MTTPVLQRSGRAPFHVPDPPPADVARVPLRTYVDAARAHPLIIIVVTLAALAGSLPLAAAPPTYESTAEILVTPIPPADRSFVALPLPRAVGDPARAVETAAEIVDSPAARTQAAGQLESDHSEESLRDEVAVSPSETGNLVEVTAEAGDPAAAAEIANAYASAAIQVRRQELRPLVLDALRTASQQLEALPNPDGEAAEVLRTRVADLESIGDGTDPTLSIAQEAVAPLAPSGLPRWLLTAIALVSGFTIGLVASVLVELLTPRRLKHEADLLAVYPLPILARVPQRRRRTRVSAPLLNLPLAETEAFRTLRTQLELLDSGPAAESPSSTPRGPFVTCVTSPSSNAGKTTVALGLACAIIRRGLAATVVDFDFGGRTVAARLGIEPERDLAAVLSDQLTLPELYTAVPGKERLALVPAPPSPDLELADRLVALAPGILSRARLESDWVIAIAPDLARSTDALTISRGCDQLVLVSRLGVTEETALAAARDVLYTASSPPTGHVILGAAAGR